MPFRLRNALATFTTLMNYILHKESNEFEIVYIDDILVFSKSKEEYKLQLKIVLEKIRDNQLYSNIEINVFFLKELESLRHVMNGKGLILICKKIEAIKTQEVPKIEKRVRFFLNLANYYRKFLRFFF